jgi:hypothetical protein
MGDGNKYHPEMGKFRKVWGRGFGKKEKNVPDDFMVPLQIFSMCCSWLTITVNTKRIFPPTHSYKSSTFGCLCEDENFASSPKNSSTLL